MFQAVFDEIDSHQRAISFLTFFEEEIYSEAVVDPGKASFYLPSLPTISPFVFILGRSALRYCSG
jgi:hypothetical protein